jgi:hypothetical protein
MAAASTNIELYTRLNTELMSMVEQFTNLIKGTKEGEYCSCAQHCTPTILRPSY